MGQSSMGGGGWHLDNQPLLPIPPISVPVPQAERHPIMGEPQVGREGAGCHSSQMPHSSSLQLLPPVALPPPSIFRSITVHCQGYFFSHSFLRKTARVPPGKEISPSPELVCGGVHTAK